MYHLCLACVFQPLKVGMTTPEVIKCPDGHFHRAVYGLRPYITDYPEQDWLAAIVQRSKFYIHFEKFDLQKHSNKFDRCNAPPNNLNWPNSHQQTHKKTDFLISTWDLGTLWSDFGICVDIVVRHPPIFQVHILKQTLVAIHTWLPSCWHPWTLNTGFAPSGHQKDIQESYCNVGQPVPAQRTWRGLCTWDYCRYWPSVCNSM